MKKQNEERKALRRQMKTFTKRMSKEWGEADLTPTTLERLYDYVTDDMKYRRGSRQRRRNNQES